MKKKVLFISVIAILVIITIIICQKSKERNNNNKYVEASSQNPSTSVQDIGTAAVNNVESNDSQTNSSNSTQGNNIESNTAVTSTNASTTNSNANENKTAKAQSSEENKNNNTRKEQKLTGNTKYYIKVNYKANAVTIYEKDDDGYFTKPIKAMICSCGKATPTSGVYKTSPGYEWGYLEGGTFGRYSTRIKDGIMFHSVPYVRESEDSLEYWEYDKLGTTASLGCVRLCLKDCKWIFDNCETGTPVEFYADSNPGPLGKPTVQKISENEECRNWDPTDTSPNSPWNK